MGDAFIPSTRDVDKTRSSENRCFETKTIKNWYQDVSRPLSVSRLNSLAWYPFWALNPHAHKWCMLPLKRYGSPVPPLWSTSLCQCPAGVWQDQCVSEAGRCCLPQYDGTARSRYVVEIRQQSVLACRSAPATSKPIEKFSDGQIQIMIWFKTWSNHWWWFDLSTKDLIWKLVIWFVFDFILCDLIWWFEQITTFSNLGQGIMITLLVFLLQLN